MVEAKGETDKTQRFKRKEGESTLGAVIAGNNKGASGKKRSSRVSELARRTYE